METYREFENRLQSRIDEIGEDVFGYREDEFWMIQSDYEFIEFFAANNQLFNTALALRLARGLHDGVYRKATVIRNDIVYKLPYVIHPLQVCRMLMELNIPLSVHEQDVLFAAALCHDMIEDIDFPEHGLELMNRFGLDRDVYDTVAAVSKRKDFTEEEERQHFQKIAENKLALLVKISDRGNNVEDLYARSSWKVHEYVGETRKYFFPMIEYGLEHYKDIDSTICILRDKIITLTDAAEYLVDRYDQQELALKKRVEDLRHENEELRRVWNELWHKALLT